MPSLKSLFINILLVFALSFPTSAVAQVQFGPSLKVGLSSFTGFNNSVAEKGDPFLGYELGLVGFDSISNRSIIRGSLRYAYEGINVMDQFVDEQFTFNAIKLDASYGLRAGDWMFTAGPMLRVLMSAERTDANSEAVDVKEGWESMVLGYNLGVNYNSGKYQFYLNYQASFDDLTQQVVLSNPFNNIRFNPGSLKFQQVSVG